jgi:DNA (cytosine-5)-methyltransferase 1
MNFIDLYAGIGGIRLAFEQSGAECVFTSEWNKYSQITYEILHGEKPDGDITHIPIDFIPDHNILAAGFPCQPFSLAGVSKKNSLGRSHGFDDPTQGTEFFKLKEILRIKQPEAFLLENVKNLRSHDKKRTFQIIEETLDTVGYHFSNKVIDSAYWVPQHRERLYIVGFRKDLDLETFLPDIFPINPIQRLFELEDILESEDEIEEKYGDKYTVTKGTWEALKRHKSNHQEKGNGFGYGVIYPPYNDKVTRTLSARYHKDGAEILISQGRGKRPRRLTPLEVFRLQGFPQHFEFLYDGLNKKPVSDNQIYKQFGNSVTIPVVSAIAVNIVNTLESILTNTRNIPVPLQLTA